MRRPLIALIAGSTLVAGLTGSPVALAGTTVGSFEIEGNRADDSGSGDLMLDWDSPPPGLTVFTDASGQGDDSFGLGSKELEPGGWTCIQGSAPGKADIVGGEIAFRTLGGKNYMFVSWTRKATDGDVHIDYEFNQSTEPNPACPELPRRTPGDIVITFDTENGGATILVRAFVWEGTPESGTFKELSLGAKGVLWDGAVNIPNTIPGHQAGDFGEAAINLTDSPIGAISCLVFSTAWMKTRSSTSITSALQDRTAPQAVNFAVDQPDLANASGGAFGARVRETVLGLNETLIPAASSQSGVGSNSSSNQLLDVDVPPPSGEILRADVVRTSARSTITESPGEATQVSTAETANVNILNGLVTAGHIRGVATSRASGAASSFSSLGSTFQDLAVQGAAVNDVASNTRIDLPADLYGPGSYVILYERIGSTSGPPPEQVAEGTYTADLTVNMIHVFVTDSLQLVPGDQTVEVIVSHADAHSDFPQTTRCPGAPTQAVSGHAFVASEVNDGVELPVTAGYVSIPATGGHDHQDLDQAAVLGHTAGASVTDSTGTLGPTLSRASSYAQATGVCVAPGPTGCTVGAELVRSESNSSAEATGARSDDGDSKLVGVVVAGNPVPVQADPNTRIEIPGVGFVILNEQFCDGGTTLPDCAGADHAGLTVRAIHLVVTVPDNPLGLRLGEVIVSEAHSDATLI
ncbi:MAG TPA: choice-of-anchor P family protein [Actinomycetota bacterium]|nr:choice-of-anchor P family protein [Actinomycetota bacterium]